MIIVYSASTRPPTHPMQPLRGVPSRGLIWGVVNSKRAKRSRRSCEANVCTPKHAKMRTRVHAPVHVHTCVYANATEFFLLGDPHDR